MRDRKRKREGNDGNFLLIFQYYSTKSTYNFAQVDRRFSGIIARCMFFKWREFADTTVYDEVRATRQNVLRFPLRFRWMVNPTAFARSRGKKQKLPGGLEMRPVENITQAHPRRLV